jgi:carbon monoxide dehydrogenase subunit G
MDMSGQQRIPASREIVWNALNDPGVLEACIPGCQELIKSSDTEMNATALVKVGPVTAKFQGTVMLSDFDPPKSYRITGEGQGGLAGFAKGTADVRLEEDGDSTILHYTVSAQVGGKLSQLGGRLIDATAKQMSSAFFRRFAEEIESQYLSSAAQAPAYSEETARPAIGGAARPRAEPTPRRQASRQPRPAPAPLDLTPGIYKHLKWVAVALLAIAAGLVWYFLGGSQAQEHVSPGFAAAVQLITVAALGYFIGRQHGADRSSRAVFIDRDLIDELADAWSSRRG